MYANAESRPENVVQMRRAVPRLVPDPIHALNQCTDTPPLRGASVTPMQLTDDQLATLAEWIADKTFGNSLLRAAAQSPRWYREEVGLDVCSAERSEFLKSMVLLACQSATKPAQACFMDGTQEHHAPDCQCAAKAEQDLQAYVTGEAPSVLHASGFRLAANMNSVQAPTPQKPFISRPKAVLDNLAEAWAAAENVNKPQPTMARTLYLICFLFLAIGIVIFATRVPLVWWQQ